MPHTEVSDHPVMNIGLTILATITGLFGGTQLADIDIILAIILKAVSILAFTALVIINWNKVIKILTGKENKDG